LGCWWEEERQPQEAQENQEVEEGKEELMWMIDEWNIVLKRVDAPKYPHLHIKPSYNLINYNNLIQFQFCHLPSNL
jgi:hypothetical protein